MPRLWGLGGGGHGGRPCLRPDRLLDYEPFRLRDEITGLDSQIGDFLASAPGRFEAWQGEQERRHPYPDEPVDENAL